MKYSIIEAPTSLGARTHGTETACRVLMPELSAIFPGDIYSNDTVDETTVLSKAETADNDAGSRAAFAGQVMKTARKVYADCSDALKKGSFPVVIGGDHSVTIGSIAASGAFYGAESLAVVYIDAHTDINTEKVSESGFIHGMTLASAMGLCSDRLTVGNKVNLLGKNTYVVGARSIDATERPIVRSQNVKLYEMENIRRRGLDAVIGEITDLIDRIPAAAIHISFDVDSLDPACFSSTGYVIESGFFPDEVTQIVSSLAAKCRVVSFDCVEYCPRLDRCGEDRKTLLNILKSISPSLIGNRSSDLKNHVLTF